MFWHTFSAIDNLFVRTGNTTDHLAVYTNHDIAYLKVIRMLTHPIAGIESNFSRRYRMGVVLSVNFLGLTLIILTRRAIYAEFSALFV